MITACDLHRLGNATSARLDHVRPKDIEHFQYEGAAWVRFGSGGVSTFAVQRPPAAGQWWTLPAGYDYGGLLIVWNDHGQHWSWEPAADMALSAYKSLLGKANLEFR